jgi:hypothetical protein
LQYSAGWYKIIQRNTRQDMSPETQQLSVIRELHLGSTYLSSTMKRNIFYSILARFSNFRLFSMQGVKYRGPILRVTWSVNTLRCVKNIWIFAPVMEGVVSAHCNTLVHVTMRVGTLSIWRGASQMRYMSKDFLGFIHSVLKGNIVGNWWLGYNCQFYTQITQNWENLVISGLFKWHKFTSYPSHSAIYWSKITNLSWNIIK